MNQANWEQVRRDRNVIGTVLAEGLGSVTIAGNGVLISYPDGSRVLWSPAVLPVGSLAAQVYDQDVEPARAAGYGVPTTEDARAVRAALDHPDSPSLEDTTFDHADPRNR
jgi:hypothetical protein